MISLREAFGRSLVTLGSKYDFVILDADVAGGTNTNFFKSKYPDRFIQCGIAEQNMMSVAAGLVNSGILPIVCAYGVFATLRPLDQIRNSISYPNLNVKIVASHLGLDTGPDGATHQAIEDLAIMRSIPNMLVLSPCDEKEMFQATKAMLEHKGPVYMRSGRSPVPEVHKENYRFKIGKADVIKKGNDKIVIFATGIMVHRALQAAEGSNATVINISTIKPIDKETVLEHAQKAEKIISCEDHNVIGGLGSCIAEVLSENKVSAALKRIGIDDVFGMSGEPEELAKRYSIDTQTIRKEING